MRRLHSRWVVMLLAPVGAGALAGAVPASAAVVLLDDFDDGVLDPAWTITLTDTSGWTGGESGSVLSVTDIARPAGVFQGWATVAFSQTVPPLSDFDVEFDFSWESALGFPFHYQSIAAILSSQDGTTIASGGYTDAWASATGQQSASAGTTGFGSGPSTQPPAGSALIEMIRQLDTIRVLWDGVEIVSGTSSLPLGQISIAFSFWDDFGNATVFGSEAVDRIRVTGTIIPEPGTAMFLGIGCLSFLRRRAFVRGRRSATVQGASSRRA